MTRPARWWSSAVRRELRRRLVAGLAVGLVLGTILGMLVGSRMAAATPPGAPAPVTTWQPVQVQPEAPQLSWGTAMPSGASSPAAPSMEPTATVAASVPESSPEPVEDRTPATAPGSQSKPALTGSASWYCVFKRSPCTVGYPASGMFAAAGPALREAIGRGWRGTVVTVTANGFSVRAQLIDWCACPRRVIDLFASAFMQLAPLSRGVVAVEVRW